MTYRPTRTDWRGSYPVFVAKITWNGRTFYASTKAMIVTSAQGSIQLEGGIESEPSFNASLSELGFQVSSYSTPMSCYLRDVDIALQASRGNTLENSYAELAYILVKGEEIQSYDNRVVLIEGGIKEPVFGHRDRSQGYFEASIEAEVLETSFHISAMGAGARISSEELSDIVNPTLSPLTAIQQANYLIEIIKNHKEKVLPIIFGQPGVAYDENMASINYGATPAYVIYAEHGSSNNIWLAIAPHDVKAPRVRIYDDLGNFRVEDVEKWVRNDGRIFSFVHFTHSSGGFQNPVDEENARFFVAWQDGGALVSNTNSEVITGAGDICMYCLEQGGQEIDYFAWGSVLPFLNTYKLAGYVTDQNMSAIEFLESEIIPLLPISVVQGTNGMKPVLDMFATGVKPTAIASIQANAEFFSESGMQRRGDTSNLVNDFTLKYAYNAHQGSYQGLQRITGDETITNRTVTLNSSAVQSFAKYGSRSKTMETTFVTDIDTAALICFDKIRNNCFPATFMQYNCNSRYGWLEIGDIVSLSDDNFSLSDKLIQVVEKVWTGTSWQFTLKLSPE